MGSLLGIAGKTLAVRQIAAELGDDTEAERLAADAIHAIAEAGEGRPGTALQRLEALELGRTTLGDQPVVDPILADLLTELALLTGADAADSLLERALTGQVDVGGDDAFTVLAQLCLHATSPRSACAHELQGVSERRELWAAEEASERVVWALVSLDEGDRERAVSQLRDLPAAAHGPQTRALLRDAGRPDLAAGLIREDRPTAVHVRGFTLDDAERALALAERGQTDEARALARRIVEAWASSDVDLPMLAPLRALVAGP